LDMMGLHENARGAEPVALVMPREPVWRAGQGWDAGATEAPA